MIKRKITETVEEYDENGKLTRKTTTETEEDDDTTYGPTISWPSLPSTLPPINPVITWAYNGPTPEVTP